MLRPQSPKLLAISIVFLTMILAVLLFHGSWPSPVKPVVDFEPVYLHGLRLSIWVGIFIFLTSAMLCYFIIFSTDAHGHMSLDDRAGVQKHHEKAVPRIGGLAIFLALLIGLLAIALTRDAFFHTLSMNLKLLLVAVPVFLGGLLEDATKHVGSLQRLIFSMISASLFVIIFHATIGSVGIAWIDQLLSYWPASLFFTVFAIAGVANSINIIDGFHGLASGLCIIILVATGSLAYMLHDILLVRMSFSLVLALMGFFIFNWPLGKLFLGDGGAYLIGFLLATVMIIFQQTQAISPWLPLNLLAYPVIETFYSIVRRLKRDKAITNPDAAHLHHLIFNYISSRYPNAASKNPLVAPCVWLPEIIFAALAVLNYQSTAALMGLFLIHVLLYIACYKLLKRLTHLS